ncbi:MAG: hypothetical protein LBR66_09265 [Candidatus Symbiothrix sp.]|jgi:hypothetical protein|nr:hypothetical protein [Candidatus Symbiothrix sp.]
MQDNWLITPEIAYRYDGYRVLNFRSDAINPKRLTDNNITALATSPYIFSGASIPSKLKPV